MPSEEGLYTLLSRLPAHEYSLDRESINETEVKPVPAYISSINSESTLIKSPISWSMPWAWAGGFSAVGAMAALVFMFSNTNNINTTANLSKTDNGMSAITVVKSTANNTGVENKKVKNTVKIDEALATVSGLENMSPDNKF